jgi:O-antigen/teichoic acid export membrane protein
MLKKNIFYNYLGSFSSVLAPLITLPYLLKILGVEAWGLIAMLNMFVAFLLIFEAGVSQVLTKELSSAYDSSATDNSNFKKYFTSFRNVYSYIGILIAIIFTLFSGFIADFWIKRSGASFEDVRLVVISAGVMSGLQFASSPYRSLLAGIGSHQSLNLISINVTFFKFFGGLLAVQHTHSIKTLIMFYLLGSIFELLGRVIVSKKYIGTIGYFFVSWNDLNRAFPAMATMSISVLISLLAMQADKVIVSYYLTIKDFSMYSIAASISMGAMQFINPLMVAFSPEIFRNSRNVNGINLINKRIYIAIAVPAVILWFIYFESGSEILDLWLSNKELVKLLYYPIMFLLLGVTINAFYNVQYIKWLATGRTKIILLINCVTLLLTIIISPLLTLKYGVNGAAFGWALINLCMLSLSFFFRTKVN